MRKDPTCTLLSRSFGRASLRMTTVLLVAGILNCEAADWPNWRGPDHNGISKEAGWNAEFPDGEPKIAWKTNVGTGFSSASVANGLLYTIGNRDGTETVYALDANTGKEAWKFSYECALDPKYFEGGPTSTPAAAGKFVYTLSRRGHLFCFDAATGKVHWGSNIAEDHGMPPPTWGFSGSPLVQGDLVILNMGAAGMAVRADSGKVVWKSENIESGYSTPVPVKRGEKTYVLLGTQKAWNALDIATGEELWSIRWLTRYNVNAADPILSGDRLVVASGYGKGAALFNWNEGADLDEIWRSKELRSQMNPAVLFDGHLYGTDGDAGNKAPLNCIDIENGETMWSERGVGTGGITIADGKLIVLSSRGELIIAPATHEGFELTSRGQVLGGKCWTVPVLANGRIYCRNADGDLACVDVRN